LTAFFGDLSLVGVDDGSFKAFERQGGQKCPLCAVKMKGPKIEDVQISMITVDGLDVTPKLVWMLRKMSFGVAILSGITFAGFNIVDTQQLFRELSRPVIVFMKDRPDNDAMKQALQKHFKDWKERWALVESLGVMYSASTRSGEPPVYFEVVGLDPLSAENILRRSALLCRVPEPLRVARLIARQVSYTSC